MKPSRDLLTHAKHARQMARWGPTADRPAWESLAAEAEAHIERLTLEEDGELFATPTAPSEEDPGLF